MFMWRPSTKKHLLPAEHFFQRQLPPSRVTIVVNLLKDDTSPFTEERVIPVTGIALSKRGSR